MIDSTRVVPFSFFLCAGLATRSLPLAPLQAVLTSLMGVVACERPSLFASLCTGERLVFLIDPVDFPFVFVFEPTASPPTVRVQRERTGVQPVATITAPLEILLALLNGKIDGDAVFFSRALTISGDTQAVVALSNILDGADIDLGRMLADRFGPLAKIVQKAVAQGEHLVRQIDMDMHLLATALLTPLQRRLEMETHHVRILNARLTALERQRREKIHAIEHGTENSGDFGGSRFSHPFEIL